MRLGGLRLFLVICLVRFFLVLIGRFFGGEGCGGVRGRVLFRVLGVECFILGRVCWSVIFIRKFLC